MIIRETKEILEKKASEIITEKINDLSRKKEHILIALPGGRSVAGILNLLKDKTIDWKKVYFFMIDERLVSLDSPDSNYKIIYESALKDLISSKKLNEENIFPFVYSGEIEKDLAEYKEKLLRFQDYFDIILVSAGEDGHIASLFPEHETVLSNEEFFITTNSSPKNPPGRMSASRDLLLKTDTAVLLFFSESKRPAFEKFMNPEVKLTSCPSKIVSKIKNNYVLVDF